jgi:hypothetical protein
MIRKHEKMPKESRTKLRQQVTKNSDEKRDAFDAFCTCAAESRGMLGVRGMPGWLADPRNHQSLIDFVEAEREADVEAGGPFAYSSLLVFALSRSCSLCFLLPLDFVVVFERWPHCAAATSVRARRLLDRLMWRRLCCCVAPLLLPACLHVPTLSRSVQGNV